MKLYTAKYKAEQPANKELHVPLNSNYCVGLQFERDGQTWELEENEVTIDEQTPDDKEGDIYIFNRTSEGPSEKTSVVKVADMGVHASVEGEVQTQSLRKRVVNTVTFGMSLSDVISEPVEVTADQINLFYRENDESAPEGDYTDAKTRSNAIWIRLGTQQLPRAIFGPDSFKGKFSIQTEGGDVETADSVVVSPESAISYSYSCRVDNNVTRYKQTKVSIDTADIIRTYELSEVAEDQGVIEGYEEKPLMKTSITLAGTNADDTTFNYTIPVIND